MKKTNGFTKRMIAILLSSMLAVGMIPGTAFASETLENTVQEEETITTYTVTLDANGGYFANEWDDVLGEYIESTEILNKYIPVGGTVTTFPLFETDDHQIQAISFSGWSLERDGELVSLGNEEYIPVDNCVLYAVWEFEEIPENDEESELQETDQVEDVSEDDFLEDQQDTVDVTDVTEDQEETASENDIQVDQSIDIIVENKEESVREDAAMGAVASGTCGDNLTWTLDDTGTLTISGTGAMTSSLWGDNYSSEISKVVIEDGVTRIKDGAFWGCSSLTSVTIPDSVTSIGDGAFSLCSSLTSVTIPDSVTSIGDRVFSLCTNLTSVTIPHSVMSIGDRAFQNCSNLTSVTIPDSVTSIGYRAFENCSSLTSVTIPDSVTSIGGTFINCSSLTSVTIPDSVTRIGDSAFYGCESLTSVTIPDSVTSIGDSAFSNCSNLTSVTIPDSVTSIGDSAFSNCSNLTSVTIPISVTSIREFAFSACSSLTSVTIPDSVTSIGDYAFYDCSSLTSVTIPDSVKSIGYRAFDNCSSLTDVYYAGSEDDWKAIYIGTGNSCLTEATIHYGYENPEEPDPTADPTDLANCSTTIVGHTFEYTGSANKPVVKGVRAKGGVKLKEGTDYTVEYKDNIEIGYGQVIIKGCGNYKGEKVEKFGIIPGKVEWKEVDYNMLDGNLKDADFSWNTLSYIVGGEAGYQIRYCDDSFSLDSDHAVTKKYPADKTNGKVTIDDLTLNSTIKYQINAYKIVNGVKFEGAWSEEEKLDIVKSKLEFPSDFWNFENLTDILDERYYKIWFGDSTFSKQLLEDYCDGSNGLCYGMCTSLLSIIERKDPSISSFSRERVNNISADDTCSSLGISARDLIKYAQTYQFVPNIWNQEITSMDDYDEVMESILSSITGEGHSIIISVGLSNVVGSHDLIPVNVLEDTNEKTVIGVYDCNSPDTLQKFTVYKKDIGSDYYYYQGSYENSILIADKDLRRAFPQTSFIDHLKQGLKNESNEPLFPTFRIEENSLLFVSNNSGNIEIDSEENITEIISSNSIIQTETNKLYWVDGTDSDVFFNNVKARDTIALMSYHNRLEVTAGSDATITLNVSEENGGKAIISQEEGASFEVRYIDMDNATDDSLETVIRGSGGNSIELSFDDDGNIYFSGINEISVSKNQGEIGEEMHIADTNPVVKDFINLSQEEKYTIETGDKKDQILFPCANGHTWNTEYTVDVEPTDDQPGAMSLHCQVCDAIKEGSRVEIPALNDNDKIINSGSCGNDVTWTLYEGGLLFISGTGSMTYSSTTSSLYWNEYKPDIKTVIVNKGVTSIAAGAFCDCTSMSSVVIPEGITVINSNTFKNCTSLTHATIPSTVTQIDTYSFRGCTSLESVQMLEGIKRILSNAFYGCSGLNSVTIPSSLVTIATNAFSGCHNLRDVKVSENVTRNFYSAFKSTPWISSMGDFVIVNNILWHYNGNGSDVVIPSGVKAIGKGAFDSYSNLESVTIPETVNSIGESAFKNCTSLTSVIIPENVDNINGYAFSGCTRLENVEIRKGVTKIGEGAFKGCTSLTELKIPDSVSIISDEAFYNCENLMSASIPGGVTNIGNSAFANCSSLNEVHISDGVTSIGNSSFSGCISLTEITIPGCVTSIGTYAFCNCDSLTDITIPSSVNSIGEHAFHYKENGEYYPLKNIIISGFYNSYAEQYAKENGFSFRTFVIDATVKVPDQSYTGKELKPVPEVSFGDTVLSNTVDFKVTYENNTNAGTAKITIAGTGNYTGTKEETFKINKANQSITAKVSASSIAVGKTATVTITGAKGTKSFKSSDTSVASVNASTGVVTGKKAGTVTITATSAATSNYNAASKTVSITVTANKTLKKPGNCHFDKWNNAKYTSCRIAWNKVDGAEGYQTLLSWTDGSHASTTIVKSNVLYRDCTVHPQHVSQMKARAFYTAGGKRVFGPWSNVEYITPSPTTLNTKNTSSGSDLKMNISWNIIYGCNGYNVFLTTNPNGTWYWNQSTSTKATATSAVITKYRGSKLKKNTRYYVRIVTRRKRNGVFCTVPMPANNTNIGSFVIK